MPTSMYYLQQIIFLTASTIITSTYLQCEHLHIFIYDIFFKTKLLLLPIGFYYNKTLNYIIYNIYCFFKKFLL